jgi:hypothetical protein
MDITMLNIGDACNLLPVYRLFANENEKESGQV